MIATLKHSVKTETKTFPTGTKVKTIAIQFGPQREYNYLCECDGIQFSVVLEWLKECVENTA